MKKILNDNYKCEGQMNIFDFIDKPKDEEAKAAAPVEDFMNPPEEAAKAADQKSKEITDDYIKENPTCFYVFGHYLDKADGWHKVPEELPTFTEWKTIDVVIFGKKTSTSWMEHEEWEAKDWTFRSKDQRRNTESTQILAWKISEDANKEIANG